jgi:hypothetical protein
LVTDYPKKDASLSVQEIGDSFLWEQMDYKTADGNQDNIKLDISKLPQGIYILRVGQGRLRNKSNS